MMWSLAVHSHENNFKVFKESFCLFIFDRPGSSGKNRTCHCAALVPSEDPVKSPVWVKHRAFEQTSISLFFALYYQSYRSGAYFVVDNWGEERWHILNLCFASWHGCWWEIKLIFIRVYVLGQGEKLAKLGRCITRASKGLRSRNPLGTNWLTEWPG